MTAARDVSGDVRPLKYSNRKQSKNRKFLQITDLSELFPVSRDIQMLVI